MLYGHFHPKLLTATEVVRFLVFILFLVKGSIWLVFGHTPTVLLEHEVNYYRFTDLDSNFNLTNAAKLIRGDWADPLGTPGLAGENPWPWVLPCVRWAHRRCLVPPTKAAEPQNP